MTRHESEEVRQDQILTAAAAVFSEHGYNASRVDDIAKAAGLSKGAIYHRFAGKGAVLAALAGRCAERIEAAGAGDGPPVERMTTALNALEPELLVVLLSQSLRDQSLCAPLLDALAGVLDGPGASADAEARDAALTLALGAAVRRVLDAGSHATSDADSETGDGPGDRFAADVRRLASSAKPRYRLQYVNAPTPGSGAGTAPGTDASASDGAEGE